MAGAIDNDDDDVIASINMVPFIDICLVLLIIFMVTSSYIVRTAFDVDLPQAASGSNVAPSTLAIEVRRDGTAYFNGERATIADIERITREQVAADPATQAIIAGDRTVDYGFVIDVVDAVKAGGVRSFALNIEREETAP